jgi:succinoglycan biosynthesis transport protein ExoP
VRCLAFTSAAPEEGKTTAVANLGMSLAATGRRVLSIDGDLRRPRLHKLLQVPQGPGLSDLLRRDPAGPPAALSRFVTLTSFPNLYVLPPGSAGIDAPELLAGQLLAKLIREIGKSFDFILIDTPPLLACSDARNYARAVEGVVLVVRSSETQKRAALAARDMLLQDGAAIIGTVLTGWRQDYPAYNYPASSNYAGT